MRNLLPEKNKRENHLEYRLRLVILYLVWIFVSIFIFLVFLIPCYIISLSREAEFAQKSEKVSGSVAAKGAADSKAKLNKSQNEVVTIEALDGQSVVRGIIDTILSYKTAGIQLIGFTIGRLQNGQRQVSITGNSKDRESLVTFSKQLSMEKLFTSVNLPVSNLSKDSNIGFSITLFAQATSTVSIGK
jgi:Tfp pilus assembly protein PilN